MVLVIIRSNDIALNENIKIGIDERNQDFRYLSGSKTDSITFVDNTISTINDAVIIIHYVARYNGNDRGSILTDVVNRFFCGFFEGNSGVCYFNHTKISKSSTDLYGDDWILSSFYSFYDQSNETGISNYCTQNCETTQVSKDLEPLSLNIAINGEYNTDWGFTELIIVTGGFPYIGSMCIEEYLSNKYNINSYRYSVQTMIVLQGINFYCLLFIIIGGIWKNYRLRYGYTVKRALDFWANQFQAVSVCCKVCCYGFCYQDCLFRDCCWGSLKGLWLRHCCASNISIFPLYNIFSAISSFTSVIYRISIARTEILL